MINAFVDKLSGLFDARFWVAFWAPAFTGVALTLALWALQDGLPAVSKWWTVSTSQQALIGVALLLGITVLAYILQALDIAVVRVYEGYWPRRLSALQRWREQAQTRRRNAETGHTPSRRFPVGDDQVRATALGNIIRSAEEYPLKLYQLDAVVWWPRLLEVLPDRLLARVDATFTPVVALLNLCTVCLLWALAGAAWLAVRAWQAGAAWSGWADNPLWPVPAVLLGGLLAAWLCYRAACAAAANYADMIRVAFDCYRHDLLAKLNIHRPATLKDEWQMWATLTQLHAHYRYPWEERPGQDNPLPYEYPPDPKAE